MAELPFMPIATDAMIADTTHMSAEEFGAHVRLLIAMWRSGGPDRLPTLDDDPVKLARIAGIKLKRWSSVVAPTVMAIMHVEGGKVSQKRLLSTWLGVQERRRKKVAAAYARWRPSKLLNSQTP